MGRMGDLLTQMATQNTILSLQGKQLDDHGSRILFLEQRAAEQTKK